MAREYIEIGSTPPAEDCIGVGKHGHREQVEFYRNQLQREFPKGTFLVKGFDHDFGRYYEVCAYYNSDGSNPEEYKAAFDAEGGGAQHWDAIAKKFIDGLNKS